MFVKKSGHFFFLKWSWGTTWTSIERPHDISSRKQFEICRKWERLDEGVFMAKKSKHNKKVVFSTTCNKRASTVDEIDEINLSEVKDQEPAPHLGCTLDDVGWSEIGL